MEVVRTSPTSAFLSPVPEHSHTFHGPIWGGVAYMVCPFKQEEWPKIFWCYEILLHLFLPRCREHRWGQDEFRQ